MKYFIALFKVVFFGTLSLLFSSLIIYGTINSLPDLLEIISKLNFSQILFLLFTIPLIIFIDIFCILNTIYPISPKPKWYFDLCFLILRLFRFKLTKDSPSDKTNLNKKWFSMNKKYLQHLVIIFVIYLMCFIVINDSSSIQNPNAVRLRVQGVISWLFISYFYLIYILNKRIKYLGMSYFYMIISFIPIIAYIFAIILCFVEPKENN